MEKAKITKPRPSLYPVPVTLVTCDTPDFRTNIITISWTGILCSDPPTIYISVRPERYSYNLIKTSGRFCINIPSDKLINSVDFCGNTSGASVDKATILDLEFIKLVEGFPPAITECHHHLFCEVNTILKLGTHHAFIANVTHEFIDAAWFRDHHDFDYAKLAPIAYCRKDYFAIGQKIGTYGFTLIRKIGQEEKNVL